MKNSADIASPTESIALRAFAVLECVVNGHAPMTLDEITTALRLPKPTVFRILNLLHDADLLRRESTSKRYTVGPRLTSFSINLWRSDVLRSQWHRTLEDAVAVTGESCNLTIFENNQVLYLDRVETNHPLRLHLDIGTRVPLHCTASGKLFLCQLSEEQARQVLGREPYKQFTSKTITRFKPLQAELAKIRKTGIGTHDCELFDDSVAIAVPVRGSDSSILAAVAMHAPSSRASIKSCMESIDMLRQAAAIIASTMAPQSPVEPAKRRPTPTRTATTPRSRTVRTARP